MSPKAICTTFCFGELRQLKQKQYPEGGQFNRISQNQPNGLSYLSTAEAIASPAMGFLAQSAVNER